MDSLASRLHDVERRFGNQIFLISDEVHHRVNWSGAEFHSPLESYPRSFGIFSFGKDFLLQGQRICYVAVSPSMPERGEMARDLERWARITGFCTPTDLMQRALCGLLDHRSADETSLEARPLRGAHRRQVRERRGLKDDAFGATTVCRARMPIDGVSPRARAGDVRPQGTQEDFGIVHFRYVGDSRAQACLEKAGSTTHRGTEALREVERHREDLGTGRASHDQGLSR